MPGFDKQSARRIAEAVRYVEKSPRNRVERPTPPVVVIPVHIGKTTTPITARAGDVPGSGLVQPRLFNGADFATLLGAPIRVLNDTGATVPAAVFVKYTIVDGSPFLLTQDCSGVA